MHPNWPYPIGTPGEKWGAPEVALWRSKQQKQRSYHDILRQIRALEQQLDADTYGTLDYDGEQFPLIGLRTRNWDHQRPAVLVTGGVHGYETSGVLGALQFAREHAAQYLGRANLLIAPCVSPWAFERIQRWNWNAVDPNRSFVENSPAPESAALMRWVSQFTAQVIVHVDLHETTDTDESEFRPALAARNGQDFEPGLIPDGFYLVDDTDAPEPAFQAAIIHAVEKITHIAPPDADGKLIGSTIWAPGVIRYPFKQLGLCAGMTDAKFKTTTEVYPDSPSANADQCNAAQTQAVCAAIEFALANYRA